MVSNSKLTKVSEEEFFSEPSYVSTLTNAQLQEHLAATRDKLSFTLDEIEDKANVSKQLGRAKDRLQARFTVMKQEQPLLLLGIGVGAVALAGVIIAGVFRSGRR
ncbi:MAG: hypothetical protein RL720_622 [Actinomycetota bacterium]|jgi:hypothetical protein